MKVENKTILVVEDEQDIRDLIHFHLIKEKYSVLIAKDGEEALCIIKKKKVCLRGCQMKLIFILLIRIVC